MQMLQLRRTLTAIIAVGFGTTWAGQQPGATIPDPKVPEIVSAITPAAPSESTTSWSVSARDPVWSKYPN